MKAEAVQWLTSVAAIPKTADTAYQLSDGHFARDRSQFVELLDAIEPEPARSHLVLTFRTFAEPSRVLGAF